MASVHDEQMPSGWHQIKSALLTEIATAATFNLCVEAADALFHARLVGQSIAQKSETDGVTGQCSVSQASPPKDIHERGVPEPGYYRDFSGISAKPRQG